MHIQIRFLLLKYLFTILLSAVIFKLNAQERKQGFTKIYANGYVRSSVLFRNLTQNYKFGGAYTPKAFILNGVYPDAPLGSGNFTGYREPLMMLQLKGNPAPNINLDVDFILDNQLSGQILNTGSTYPRRIQTYRYLNFGGLIDTRYGRFEIKTGGVIFYNMSPSTLWNFEYRDDMFERYPWEWQTISIKRYEAFYHDKNIARDSRWGSGTIQGVTLTGLSLPFRTGFKFAFGKSNSSGGFQSYLSNNNKYIIAGQLSKKAGSHLFAINSYNSRGIINDALFLKDYHNTEQENILTGEAKINAGRNTAYAEAGAGSIQNPIDSVRHWNPMINLKANITKSFLPFQFSAQYYYIGPDVVNLNSSILNTSNRNVQPKFGQELQYNITTFEGAVTEFGQLANNRQGINLSAAKDLGNLKIILSANASQEIKNKFDTITFQHRLNGINRSQFIFYRNQLGPYGRQTNTWRRSWEKLAISDSAGYKKSYNLLDLSLKYKTYLFGREIIFSNYINYNSVQRKFSPISVFSSRAYLRAFYQEFMVFLNVHRKLTLVGLVGYEKNIGNKFSPKASNGSGINQTGHGYGVGLDFDINATTGLYFRQRWYDFRDKNWTLDKFRGYDTNVELKIFF